jgi:hypothetical protein
MPSRIQKYAQKRRNKINKIKGYAKGMRSSLPYALDKISNDATKKKKTLLQRCRRFFSNSIRRGKGSTGKTCYFDQNVASVADMKLGFVMENAVDYEATDDIQRVDMEELHLHIRRLEQFIIQQTHCLREQRISMEGLRHQVDILQRERKDIEHSVQRVIQVRDM